MSAIILQTKIEIFA